MRCWTLLNRLNLMERFQATNKSSYALIQIESSKQSFILNLRLKDMESEQRIDQYLEGSFW